MEIWFFTIRLLLATPKMAIINYEKALLDWEKVHREQFVQFLLQLGNLRRAVDAKCFPLGTATTKLEEVEDELLEAFYVLENRVLPKLKLQSDTEQYNRIMLTLPEMQKKYAEVVAALGL